MHLMWIRALGKVGIGVGLEVEGSTHLALSESFPKALDYFRPLRVSTQIDGSSIGLEGEGMVDGNRVASHDVESSARRAVDRVKTVADGSKQGGMGLEAVLGRVHANCMTADGA